MPPGRRYKSRRTSRRRRTTSTALTTTLPAGRFGVVPFARAASRAMPYAHAAELGYQYAANIHRMAQGLGRGKTPMTPLKQTKATMGIRRRGRGRPKRSPGLVGLSKRRHEKLKLPQSRPLVKGKGFNQTATGVIITHPNSKVPKWKMQRLNKYKNMVYQTVLLSRSNRLSGSNNTLQTTRYPLKMPECIDGEKTMSVIFTPFCSHYSGVHTTFYRKVAPAGNAITHDTDNRLDVIQHKADSGRFNLNKNINVAGNTEALIPTYEGPTHSDDVQAATNFTAITTYKDQLVRHIGIDLVFIASRAFPVEVSVSVVRAIKPQDPYTLTTGETQELCNGVGNHGMDWSTWRTEFFHRFTLKGLEINKKPPHYSIKKILKTNFLQTNTFNENTTAQDMSQAATTQLGSNIHSHMQEVADGNMSGNFYILIKYRKVQEPQQFTYKQTIEADSDSTSSRFPSASVELPVITEESFDVPTHDGITGADASGTQFETGEPLTNNQGDESKASFYLNGKLTYGWGFKEETEPIPSIMSNVKANANWKKAQSLNIDPTYDPTNDDHGIYCQSHDHVNIVASTANTGV